MASPEVVSGSHVVSSPEVLITGLAQWWPYVDVYVDPKGDARAPGTTWNVYAVAGSERTLLGSGQFEGDITTPSRVLTAQPGAGTTIELWAVTAGKATTAALVGVLVGYDPSQAPTAPASNTEAVEVLGAAINSANWTTLATLVNWHPETSVLVDASAISGPSALLADWRIVAHLAVGAGINAPVAGTQLTAAKETLFRGLYGGASNFLVQARTKHEVVTGINLAIVGNGPAAAGGGGGGSSFPTVANLAALAALVPATAGAGARVLTLLANFWLDPASVLAPNGITVVAAVGGGNWIRDASADLTWSRQDTWYVNSGTGNDENAGNTALAALKTHAELVRRWGSNLVVGIVDGSGLVTVNVQHMLSTDTIDLETVNVSPAIVLTYVGATAPLFNGTFTAVTTVNQATNTPWGITDAGKDFTAPNLRVRDTTTGNNELLFANAILSGTDHFRSSWPWSVVNGVGVATLHDAYTAEALVSIPSLNCALRNGVVTFADMFFVSAQVPRTQDVTFAGCIFSTSLAAQGGHVFLVACHAAQDIIAGEGCSFEADGGDSANGLRFYENGTAVLTNYLVGGAPVFVDFGAVLQVADLGVFIPAAVTVPYALILGDATGHPSGAIVSTNGPLWGVVSNANPAVLVGRDAILNLSEIPTLSNGGAINFKVGGATTSRGWHEAGGAYTAAQNNTWANWNVGLMKNAHNLATNSSVTA